MRFMMDQYFKDEPMDKLNKGLLTFAAYNAGPGRIRQLRREAEKRGLDPNVWFGNVERVASERIGRETVTYVSNIYKYYITYRLLSRSAGATRGGEGGGREAQVRLEASMKDRQGPLVDVTEQKRLNDAREAHIPWKKWGPYLSERQWGTVREDYSDDGNAWDYFTHDQARSRAYRWGEDGLGGFSDDKQRLCFALAFGTSAIRS